jgi:hypothetical protein
MARIRRNEFIRAIRVIRGSISIGKILSALSVFELRANPTELVR